MADDFRQWRADGSARRHEAGAVLRSTAHWAREGVGLLDATVARHLASAAEAVATHASAWAGHIRKTSTRMHQRSKAWTAQLHAAELRTAARLEQGAKWVRQELGDVWHRAGSARRQVIPAGREGLQRTRNSLHRGRVLAHELREARRERPGLREDLRTAMARATKENEGRTPPLEAALRGLVLRMAQAADRFTAKVAELRNRIWPDNLERAYGHAARLMQAGVTGNGPEAAATILRAAHVFDALVAAGPEAAGAVDIQSRYLAVAVEQAKGTRSHTAVEREARKTLQAATASADPSAARVGYGALARHYATQGRFTAARRAVREYDALARFAPQVRAFPAGLREQITRGTRMQAAERVFLQGQEPILRAYLATPDRVQATSAAAAAYGQLADRLGNARQSGPYALSARERQGNFLLAQAHEEANRGNRDVAVTVAAQAGHELRRAVRSTDPDVAAVASYRAVQARIELATWDPDHRREHLRAADLLAARLRPAQTGRGTTAVRVTSAEIDGVRATLATLQSREAKQAQGARRQAAIVAPPAPAGAKLAVPSRRPQRSGLA